MTDQQDARHLLDRAERAATAGDLASAEELLRGAARIQEETLGPLHPDLANTFNNLAIVAEKTGNPGDAETFYRRAAAIASASLPPGIRWSSPAARTSRLLPRAWGVDRCPRPLPPTRDTDAGRDAFAPEDASGADETPILCGLSTPASRRRSSLNRPAGRCATLADRVDCV